MSYENFQRCKNDFYKTHITLDNLLSCLAITAYIGGIGFLTYKFIKDYGFG